jgi:uncharacterized membrane protein (DUF441 family)
MPMLWDAMAFAAVGLIVAYVAGRALPYRFSSRRLVLATGPAAALLGGFLSLAVLGSSHLLLALTISAAFAAALLSLLVRPTRRGPSTYWAA